MVARGYRESTPVCFTDATTFVCSLRVLRRLFIMVSGTLGTAKLYQVIFYTIFYHFARQNHKKQRNFYNFCQISSILLWKKPIICSTHLGLSPIGGRLPSAGGRGSRCGSVHSRFLKFTHLLRRMALPFSRGGNSTLNKHNLRGRPVHRTVFHCRSCRFATPAPTDSIRPRCDTVGADIIRPKTAGARSRPTGSTQYW